MQNPEVLPRSKHLIEHLEDSWKQQLEISSEKLRQIVELVVNLKEPYRTVGLKVVAEHIVNDMSLHILDILSTFQQKAEEDGISPEDCKETLEFVLPKTFQVLDKLTKNLSIQSLDDVATLSNITLSLQSPSDTSSADEAQSLLYELPEMYYSQLTYEHLVTKEFIDWTLQKGIKKIAQSVTLKLKISGEEVRSTPIPVQVDKISYLPVA